MAAPLPGNNYNYSLAGNHAPQDVPLSQAFMEDIGFHNEAIDPVLLDHITNSQDATLPSSTSELPVTTTSDTVTATATPTSTVPHDAGQNLTSNISQMLPANIGSFNPELQALGRQYPSLHGNFNQSGTFSPLPVNGLFNFPYADMSNAMLQSAAHNTAQVSGFDTRFVGNDYYGNCFGNQQPIHSHMGHQNAETAKPSLPFENNDLNRGQQLHDIHFQNQYSYPASYQMTPSAGYSLNTMYPGSMHAASHDPGKIGSTLHIQRPQSQSETQMKTPASQSHRGKGATSPGDSPFTGNTDSNGPELLYKTTPNQSAPNTGMPPADRITQTQIDMGILNRKEAALITSLMNAMNDVHNAEDNPGMIQTWKKHKARNQDKIRRVCESLLVIMRQVQAEDALEVGEKKSANIYSTFDERFKSVRKTLQTQKTVCKHLMEEPYSHQVVTDPKEARRRVQNNRRVNQQKKEAIEKGRKLIGQKGQGKGRPSIKIGVDGSSDFEGELDNLGGLSDEGPSELSLMMGSSSPEEVPRRRYSGKKPKYVVNGENEEEQEYTMENPPRPMKKVKTSYHQDRQSPYDSSPAHNRSAGAKMQAVAPRFENFGVNSPYEDFGRPLNRYFEHSSPQPFQTAPQAFTPPMTVGAIHDSSPQSSTTPQSTASHDNDHPTSHNVDAASKNGEATLWANDRSNAFMGSTPP